MEKEYVYKCKKHGELTIEEVGKYKASELPQGFRYRCKTCMRDNRVVRYYANQEENIKKAGDWKKANRPRINEQKLLDKAKNPEKYKKWNKDYYERNADSLQARGVSRRRDIRLDDYYKMIDSQENKCAICNKEETRTHNGKIVRLCMDHCHKTQKIRELLCHDCNTAIGKMKDDVNILQSAINYLNKHNEAE